MRLVVGHYMPNCIDEHLRSRVGAVVTATTCHQCVQDLIPTTDVACRLSFLVPVPCPGAQVSSSSEKPVFEWISILQCPQYVLRKRLAYHSSLQISQVHHITLIFWLIGLPSVSPKNGPPIPARNLTVP